MENRPQFLEQLSGNGIEIGALHRPCLVPHLNVQYVDRLSRDDAFIQYPELKGLDLVNPDILDDAEKLNKIDSNSMDFVLSNHVIEHMRDPIGSLLNWCRVLKTGGRLFMAIPNKNNTFDRDRDITEYDHLLLDHKQVNKDLDFEHFKDFALYVSCRTYNVKPESEYLSFAHELWEKDYSIHYHVWDFNAFSSLVDNIIQDFKEFKMKVVGKLENPNTDEFLFLFEKTELS